MTVTGLKTVKTHFFKKPNPSGFITYLLKSAPLNLVLVSRIMALYKFTYLLTWCFIGFFLSEQASVIPVIETQTRGKIRCYLSTQCTIGIGTSQLGDSKRRINPLWASLSN